MLSYPTENEKGLYCADQKFPFFLTYIFPGKFIGIFWSIFNLGGVVGAAVSFGQNYHSTGSHGENSIVIFLDLLYH